MTSARLIEERVKQALRLGVADAVLAGDFAKECQKVNARLEQLREVLDSGLEMQALLMAETPPSILEEASALQSVAREWKQLCEANHVDEPPELLFQAAQQLNLLYSKGFTLNNLIYKDFREAMMARNDLKAMEISRAIERLNPSDPNAKQERERLESKVFRARESLLNGALEEGDSKSISERMEELESLGLRDWEKESLVWRRAQEYQYLIARDLAIEELEQKRRTELSIALENNNEPSMRETLARIDTLCSTFGLEVDASLSNDMVTTRERLRRTNEAAQQVAAFQSSLHALLIQVDRVDSLLQGSPQPDLRTTQDALSDLKKYWKSVENHSMEVSPETVQKVARQAQILEDREKQLQRRIQMFWASGIAAVLIALVASGWWILGVYSAGRMVTEIRSAIKASSPKALDSLIQDAEAKELTRFSPSLVATLAEARSFHLAENQKVEEAMQDLKKFEDQLVSSLSNVDAIQLKKDWAIFQDSVAKLAPENRNLMAHNISAVDKAIQSHLREFTDTLFTTLRQKIQDFDKNFLIPMRNVQTIKDFQIALTNAQSEAKNWESLLQSLAPSTTPVPAELQARATEALRSINAYSDALEQAKKHLASMMQAKTLHDFEKHRKDFASSLNDFPITEIQQARLALAQPITPDSLLARLIMPWSPPTWSLVIQGGETARDRPDELNSEELKVYSELYKSANDKIIFDNFISGSKTTENSNSRSVYSLSKPLFKNDYESKYSDSIQGLVYDPEFDKDSVVFSEKKFHRGHYSRDKDYDSIDNKGECKFSKMFQRIKLEKFIDADNRPQFSIWEMIDRATQSPAELDPVYLAYLVQQVDTMSRFRPRTWGTHFAPSFKALQKQISAKLQGITVKQYDWISPSGKLPRERLNGFSLQSTKLSKESKFLQNLSQGAKNSLEFVGFINAESQPVVQPTSSARELWGLSGDVHSPSISLVCKRNSLGQWEMSPQVFPFSPLFAMKGDRKEFFDNATKLAGITDWSGITVPPLVEDLLPSSSGGSTWKNGTPSPSNQ